MTIYTDKAMEKLTNKDIVKKEIIEDFIRYYHACSTFDTYGHYYNKEIKKEIRFFLMIELLCYYKKSSICSSDILYRRYQK